MRESLSPRQEEAHQLMKQLLGDDLLRLEVRRYALEEEFDRERCHLRCTVAQQPGNAEFELQAEGVGMLDAFFGALRKRYDEDHPSLRSIRFSSFLVKGLMAAAKGDQASDAQAEAIVGLSNSEGVEFEFRAVSSSVGHSSVEALLGGVEYFINAERAYIKAYHALQYAKKNHRPELVTKYTSALAQIVRNTSYSATIERLRKGG